MGWLTDFFQKAPKREMYLSPPIERSGDYNYHFALDKKDMKLYYCKLSTDEMQDVITDYPGYTVEYIQNAPGNIVVCTIYVGAIFNTFNIKFQRLENGDIMSEQFFNLDEGKHTLTIYPKPKRAFVPQGHADFDKLAVLFDVAKV